MPTEECSQDQNIIDQMDFKETAIEADTLCKGKNMIQQFIDVFSTCESVVGFR